MSGANPSATISFPPAAASASPSGDKGTFAQPVKIFFLFQSDSPWRIRRSLWAESNEVVGDLTSEEGAVKEKAPQLATKSIESKDLKIMAGYVHE